MMDRSLHGLTLFLQFGGADLSSVHAQIIGDFTELYAELYAISGRLDTAQDLILIDFLR